MTVPTSAPPSAPANEDRSAPSVAYVTTRYPSVSHTFILREVEALRARGVDVVTVSIRESTGEHVLSEEDLAASASTFSIRPPRWREVLRAHACAASASPRAYASTFLHAQRLARPGAKGRLWQVFYFAEALVLWHHCTTRGARHVHAHHGSPPADVALLSAAFGSRARRGPATWSMTLHGPTEFANTRWYRLAEKIRQASGVVCISSFARSQAMALVEPRHWSKMEIVHCGLNVSRYEVAEPPRQRARQRILCVGRLVPEKGHAVLIAAVARLRDAGREVELEIVGSGPGEQELRRLTAQLELSRHVTFAGAVGQEEIGAHYAAADLFCSSSFCEGLPVVLMEALASGRAVVATAIAGVRELIVDGESGLLVAPGDVGELAEAIDVLLNDEQLRTRLAGNGRRRVLEGFDVDRSAAQLDRFFARISDERPSDSAPSTTCSAHRPAAKLVDENAGRRSTPTSQPGACHVEHAELGSPTP